jgi:hypothetical protein
LLTQTKPLPKDVVDVWPEVFEEVTIKTLPLLYLHSVVVDFKDSKSWEIKLTAKIKKEGWESFWGSLDELLTPYNDTIVDVEFKMDAVKVKKDVEKLTNKFLKKKKL